MQIAKKLKVDEVPEALQSLVFAKAKGHPLYTLELVALMLEKKLVVATAPAKTADREAKEPHRVHRRVLELSDAQVNAALDFATR